MNVRIHPVSLTGIYDTTEEAPYIRQKYGVHGGYQRDDGTPSVNGATQKMINAVQSINKKKINVVDFGGGNGKMYSTLKQQTDKSFDYMIVELPDVNNTLGEEVTYHTSLNEIKKPVDILYTDATIYITEAPMIENIQNICSVGAEYIVLNRTILFFHQAQAETPSSDFKKKSFSSSRRWCPSQAETPNSDFKKKSFYTWVPLQENYYNILELSEYEKHFESAGYEITLRTFTQRVDDSPPRQVFSLKGRTTNDPVITYFDHVLRKRS